MCYQDEIIQTLYNYMGNKNKNQSANILYCKVDDYFSKILTVEQMDYLRELMCSIDRTGFFDGAKAILNFIANNNE